MNSSKIHPKLLEQLGMAEIAGATRDLEEFRLPVIVKLRPLAEGEIGAADALPIEVQRDLTLISAVAGQATQAEINELAARDDVEQVWLDEPISAKLEHSIPLLGIDTIWQGGNEGQGIKIAILDTGVDESHPDLQGRVIAQTDFTGQGNDDGNGHGTHVAGIVAGDGSASNGRFRGVAPQAELIAAKVLKNNRVGNSSWAILGLEWAMNEGAQIINLSLGTDTPSDGNDALSVACNNAVQAGFVLCVAAGNEGPNPQTVGSPGAAELVITVGATTLADDVADFSSRGPTLDGREKPDILLPGHQITSLLASTAPNFGVSVNAHYTVDSGTSMATPLASGIAALMLVVNPTLTPADVKAILRASALDLGLDPNTQGAGRVQGDFAVNITATTVVPT